jgi:hypothetical protein
MYPTSKELQPGQSMKVVVTRAERNVNLSQLPDCTQPSAVPSLKYDLQTVRTHAVSGIFLLSIMSTCTCGVGVPACYAVV